MIPPYIQNDVAGNSIPPFNTVFLKFTIFLGSTTVHRWRTLLKFVTPPTQLRCRFMRIELSALKIFSLISDWTASKSAWAMIKRWWTKIFKAKRRLSIYTRRLNSILRGLAGGGQQIWPVFDGATFIWISKSFDCMFDSRRGQSFL